MEVANHKPDFDPDELSLLDGVKPALEAVVNVTALPTGVFLTVAGVVAVGSWTAVDLVKDGLRVIGEEIDEFRPVQPGSMDLNEAATMASVVTLSAALRGYDALTGIVEKNGSEVALAGLAVIGVTLEKGLKLKETVRGFLGSLRQPWAISEDYQR